MLSPCWFALFDDPQAITLFVLVLSAVIAFGGEKGILLMLIIVLVILGSDCAHPP